MSQHPISQLASVIAVTVDAAEESRGRYILQPNYGARAESEAAAEFAEQASFAVREDNMPVLNSYTTALLGLTAAGDELRCVRTLLVGSDSMPVYGPAALLRTVMEVSARSWWTLEPGIRTRRRVLRGYIDQLTSLIETSRIRVGETSERDELVRTTSLKRLDARLADLGTLDIEVRRNRRGAYFALVRRKRQVTRA